MPNFCLPPASPRKVFLHVVLAHIIISHCPLPKISCQSPLYIVFSIFSKTGNLQEIRRQQIPDEHLVKAIDLAKGLFCKRQLTISDYYTGLCLTQRTESSQQRHICLEKGKLIRVNSSLNITVCITQIGNYYISMLLVSTGLIKPNLSHVSPTINKCYQREDH